MDILEKIKSFLFENKGAKQTVFKNTFWSGFAEAINKLIKLFLIIFIARLINADEYGKFNFAMSFAGMFGIIADLGVSSIIAREFAKDRENERYFSELFTLKFILASISLVACVVVSIFSGFPLLVNKIIWVWALINFTNAVFYLVPLVLHARQRAEYGSLLSILQTISTAAFVYFLISRTPGSFSLAIAYFLGSFIPLAAFAWVFSRRVYSFWFKIDFNLWRKYLEMSWPLAILAFFSTIYTSTDTIILGYFKLFDQVGYYNAALKIMTVITIPAGIISSSFFPMLCKKIGEGASELQKIWNLQISCLIVLILPIFAGGYFLAPKIIDYVYYQGYAQSVEGLRILLFVVLIIVFSQPFTQMLTILDRQKKLLVVSAITAILNIPLDYYLIIKTGYRYTGAAWATVITMAAAIILFYFFVKQEKNFIEPVNGAIVLVFLSSLVSSLLMILILKIPWIYSLNIFLIIFVGAIFYSVILFIQILLLSKTSFKNCF